LLRGTDGGAPRPILGAIPVGSGNDYAKMLKVSRADPALAAAALLDGPAPLVDVGILEGAAPRDAPDAAPEVFLNNLGLAFAGEANAKIESTRGLPGYTAYLVGAAMAFVTYRPSALEVEVDGQRITGSPTIVHVNLGRFCGGGVVFTPDADLQDGLFDVFVLAELTRIQAILRWKAVTTGQGRTLPDVAILRGAFVTVRGPEGRLLHADGEVRRFVGREVRARVAPQALRVIHGAPVLVAGGTPRA
ncbi:hypothetical protein HY251_06435, partial [bacterium]|nr:hypothetical protein [bacterium]